MRDKKLIFVGFLLLATQAFSQTTQLDKQIKQVENNLIPYVPIKGFKGWNIIDRMKYYNVPGVSIAVIKDFKIAWSKGYGLADTTKKIPVTTETMFKCLVRDTNRPAQGYLKEAVIEFKTHNERIVLGFPLRGTTASFNIRLSMTNRHLQPYLFSAGSISKFLMAVTALKMVENKQIELEAPINNYLTSWKIAENDFTKKTPITLRMLLSHSAGTSQTSYFGFTPNQPLPNIVEILRGDKISESRPVVVNSEPNKEFRYSGGGSVIAQLALMDVSKQSFESLTQSILFDKLGMKNSSFTQPVSAKFDKQCAWAYSSASWFKGMPYVYPQQAAAGLYSTPSDLAKFFIDIQKSYLGKGKVLSQAMTKRMLTPQQNVSDGAFKEQIAIGPFLIQRTDNKDPKGVYFEFTGVNAGFLAFGIASIEGGNGVVIMLNSGDNVNGLGKEIRRAVAKVYNWTNFLPEEIQPIRLSENELDKFTGRYKMSDDEVLVLKRENGYLVEKINEGLDIYCFPIAKDTIVFSDFNIKGFFIRDNKGEVIGLQNIYQEKPMPKMKEDEFSPSEYLRMKKYDEAKNAFRQMKMNEYKITYLAYDLMNKKPMDSNAVKTILELAVEQNPTSSIVYSRWGDYYIKLNDKANAIKSYEKAVQLDPNDQQTKEMLLNLKK